MEYTIKNIGNCKAKETTQVYVGDPVCSVKRPPKELRSFMKVELKSGEAVRVSLTLNSKDLSFYDEASADWKLEKGEFIIYVGSSSGDIRLSGSIDI